MNKVRKIRFEIRFSSSEGLHAYRAIDFKDQAGYTRKKPLILEEIKEPTMTKTVYQNIVKKLKSRGITTDERAFAELSKILPVKKVPRKK